MQQYSEFTKSFNVVYGKRWCKFPAVSYMYVLVLCVWRNITIVHNYLNNAKLIFAKKKQQQQQKTYIYIYFLEIKFINKEYYHRFSLIMTSTIDRCLI